MKSATAKKFSILGFILIIASAVIAAVLPTNSTNKIELADDGTIIPSSDGESLTCVLNPGGSASCSLTTITATTVDAANNSYNMKDDCDTIGGTSVTNYGETSECR
jgi:hypothetical protein